eukprot:1143983-Pelagomonas_calceolata.AAC.4
MGHAQGGPKLLWYSYKTRTHTVPARDADDECCLVWGASASSDAESSIPSPVDALTGVLEVQLDTLRTSQRDRAGKRASVEPTQVCATSHTHTNTHTYTHAWAHVHASAGSNWPRRLNMPSACAS